jgi:SAM-dependent methyltransferase
MPVLCRYLEWQESHEYSDDKDIAKVPPASLRFRVHGSPDKNSFMSVGRKCAQDIDTSLHSINRELNSFNSILDFGCGCGRTLLFLSQLSNKPSYHGTDIDGQAITWSAKNLRFSRFNINNDMPPLIYDSETFDLIYAISVFTHLDEDRQFSWLSELKRVLKPKGILLLTLHGYEAWKNRPFRSEVKRKGFKFLRNGATKGIFPDWYQTAYHTEDYVRKKYANYFTVLDYVPKSMNNFQDVVILQNL